MRLWITRTSSETFMVTSLPPTLHRVRGFRRIKAYVTPGDPIGVRNLCRSGILAIAPGLSNMNQLSSVQVDISVSPVEGSELEYLEEVPRA